MFALNTRGCCTLAWEMIGLSFTHEKLFSAGAHQGRLQCWIRQRTARAWMTALVPHMTPQQSAHCLIAMGPAPTPDSCLTLVGMVFFHNDCLKYNFSLSIQFKSCLKSWEAEDASCFGYCRAHLRKVFYLPEFSSREQGLLGTVAV